MKYHARRIHHSDRDKVAVTVIINSEISSPNTFSRARSIYRACEQQRNRPLAGDTSGNEEKRVWCWALAKFLPSPPYEHGKDSFTALIIEVQRQPKWKAIFVIPVLTLKAAAAFLGAFTFSRKRASCLLLQLITNLPMLGHARATLETDFHLSHPPRQLCRAS